MKRGDRESVRDFDSHDGLFFGGDDHEHDVPGHHDQASGAVDGHVDDHHTDETISATDHDLYDDPHDYADDDADDPLDDHVVPSRSRVANRRRSRNKRRKRVLAVLALLVVVLLGVSVYFIGLPIYRYVFPADYDGAGNGSVVVTVRANQNTSDIGRTLEREGVVASERAFTDAAESNSRIRNIQPGSYKLRKHMAAGRAVTLLVDPSSRLNSDTVVPEGATVVDVEKRLIAKPCTDSGSTDRICGLGLSKDKVSKALTNVRALGIPTDYLPEGKAPTSVEGFLFPATYTFDDETTVTDALQQMVGKFTDQARATKFSAEAEKLGLKPYDALIIASIAQAEAKFPEDFPKVARVILNRIKANKPLQVDATSAYAAKLKGLDPTEEIYAQTKGPFNTYVNDGLPPTPIGNPGDEAMKGAVSPPSGSWMFYVNKDAAGHLGFYTDEKSFIKAQQKCHDEGWGCAAP